MSLSVIKVFSFLQSSTNDSFAYVGKQDMERKY